MTRIRVIGYIEVDALHGDAIDLENPTGLSEVGLESFTNGRDGTMAIQELDDLEFELEEENDEDE